MFRSIKGTKDILPDEIYKWQFDEKILRENFHRFNYKEIRTPIFEQTSLFSRSIGESTDIVGKEMYSFLDRSQDSLTLKPEGTASVIRAFIQNNLGEAHQLTKVYYISPMFRQERPQAGRLRQFHQFGAEAIGSSNASVDADVIALAISIYNSFKIENNILEINSVGCPKCRPQYRTILQKELLTVADKLSPESRQRIMHNPMRVLDSKDESDKNATKEMPLIFNFLCSDCQNHFSDLQKYLNLFKIPFTINNRLVRGLDYYTRTAFEISNSSLGSQDALAGGGRYDLLCEELGGKSTPSVGFAAGIERLLMVLEKNKNIDFNSEAPEIYFVSADETAREFCIKTTIDMRLNKISAECDYLNRSVKAQMRDANRQNAKFVAVIGEREIESKSINLKQMSDGKETHVTLNSLQKFLTKHTD